MNLSLQSMNATTHGLELSMVVDGDSAGAPLFKFLDPRFDRGLVDAHNLVMLMHLDVQGLAESYHQMLFIQLGVTLYGFVFDVFGDIAQLSQSFVFEFVMCVRHIYPS